MLFNSYSFIFVFLPVVLLGFFLLARLQARFAATWLALASLFFYGYWNPVYVGLLMASIVVNYGFARWMIQANAASQYASKKQILITAITANLLLLGYYKYAGFFINTVNAVAATGWSFTELILPLGISFFTFTQIAFLVDTHRGRAQEPNFTNYVLFVTFFPHLIAGPVLHHKDMMPQFASSTTYHVQWNKVSAGLLLFTLGLCKKILWADSLAPYVTGVFDGVSTGAALGLLPTFYEAWAGALAYTLQIYFDFSGYTDMALGVALMFNIKLPINFNSPYQAISIIDFWRRWHMTLSTFLKDYLYIPLGGNRHGPVRRYLALLTTMLLGGLWHGAGWTFVVWGALHGAYLVINHGWRAFCLAVWPRPFTSRLVIYSVAALSGMLTFVAVVAAWVVFKAADMQQAMLMLKAMFGIAAQPISWSEVTHGKLLLQAGQGGLSGLSGRSLVLLLVPGLLWVWLLPNGNRWQFVDRNGWVTALQVVLVLAALYVCIDRFGSYSPFLYFQF